MAKPAASLVGSVQSYLARLVDRVTLVRALGLVFFVLLGARLLAGADGWAVRSAWPLILDGVLLTGLVAVVWWRGRMRSRLLAERRLTVTMEAAAGVPDGLLQGALEMERAVPEGVSGALATQGLSRVTGQFTQPVPALSGVAGYALQRSFRQGRNAAAGLALVCAFFLVLSAGPTLSAWGGLSRPLSILNGPELPPLTLFPGNGEFQRGSAVEVEIQAPLREEVTVHWQAAGDVSRTAAVAVESGAAAFVVDELSSPVRYWVSAPDGARTEEFLLRPVDPLFVNDVTVRIDYPSYLGRPSEEFRGDIPPFVLPEGTELGLAGRASRPLQAAALVLEGDRVLEIPVDEARFEATFRPTRDGSYGWDFTDLDGDAAALVPPALEVGLVADSAPSVSILIPVADTLLPDNLRQPLMVEATDDYGLRTLELVAWRVTALGDTLPPVAQSVDLGGTPAAVARPVLDVRDWELLPGDQVRYFARVRDIHPTGQGARTPEHVLRMPTAEELRRQAQLRLDDAASMLRELQDQADAAAEETRELERQQGAPDREAQEGSRNPAGDPGSFSEREEVRQALEEQKRLTEAADSLGSDLSALSESLQDAGAADPELTEDIRELQELLNEMGGAELQERLASLMEEMDQMGSRERQQTLEELTQQQEAFREQLQEALERAQRAALEQDFRSTTDEASALAEEQKALASSMTEEDLTRDETSELRTEQQEALAEAARELQERMDDLGDRLQELGETDAARQMLEAQNAAQRARSAMERAANEAASQSQQAASTAQQASEAMDEAASELMQAQQQMMSERARAFESALRQTTRDALSLAGEQARAREQMAGATSEELAAMRAQVSAVQQGLASLAENTAVAARTAGADDRELSTQMGEAMEALSRSREALARSGRSSAAPEAAADQAIAALNEVAQTALGTLRAMQEAGQSGQPSPEQMMEQLEQMAQEQAELNNQASQMMPMQLTPQAQQEMMEQMAQQQQEIASDLGQMSNQEGEDGPLGDLEAMAQEAEALAQELEGGRLDSQVRERQERLFHRLLDAGRGLEKEEESTERESEAPGEVELEDVEGLRMDDLGLSRYRLPDAATLNRLPPAARALVLQYFQRLNQSGGGS